MLHPVALQRGVPGVHFPLGSLKPRLGLVLSGLSPRPCPLSLGWPDSRCGCRPSRLGTGHPQRPLTCVLSAQHLALQGDRSGAVWLLRCRVGGWGGRVGARGATWGRCRCRLQNAASVTEGARVLNILYLRFFENLSLNFQPNFIFKLCRKTGCLLSILPSEIL